MKYIKTFFIHNRKLFSKIKKHTKNKKINKICSILIFSLLYVIDIQFFEVKTKIPFKGRIFLCTSYNNEAEVAYIHIWRIYDYIYKFIFVTSNRTHSGFLKTLLLNHMKKILSRIWIKLILFIIMTDVIKMNILIMMRFGVQKYAKEIMLKFI